MDDFGHSTETFIWTTTDNFMLPGTRSDHDKHIYLTVRLEGTLFNVEELLAGANDLGVGRTVKISQKGIYFECTGKLLWRCLELR
jgi:hypothetical protein